LFEACIAEPQAKTVEFPGEPVSKSLKRDRVQLLAEPNETEVAGIIDAVDCKPLVKTLTKIDLSLIHNQLLVVDPVRVYVHDSSNQNKTIGHHKLA
jgi:hypothetical protein